MRIGRARQQEAKLAEYLFTSILPTSLLWGSLGEVTSTALLKPLGQR
jgi:hypothetical protein